MPYKSSAQSAVDLISGRLEMQFATIAPTLANIRANQLRALAVSGRKRSDALPDLPTMDEAGVKGYVRKDSPSEDLIRAIEAARVGEFYVDPGLSSTIVLDEGDRTLSARQREILQMLADGMQTDAVAQKLGLSTETVRTHTKRILAKLDASTRTQAVAIGIRHGLIE